jgi:hypothetical protein
MRQYISGHKKPLKEAMNNEFQPSQLQRQAGAGSDDTHLSKLTVMLMLSIMTVCLLLTGCFSYTKEEARASTPAVVGPSATSPTTTIGTEDGLAQRQRMTIYLDPWILGSR